ncbi:hypothetical protein BSM4216_1830 [Bacillus smithii]|nr:hypothetical protein BSM4216_1830 [Bacillus smithii]
MSIQYGWKIGFLPNECIKDEPEGSPCRSFDDAQTVYS